MNKLNVTVEYKKELVVAFSSAAISLPFVIIFNLRPEAILSSFFLGLAIYILSAKKAVFGMKGITPYLVLTPPYSWLLFIVYLAIAIFLYK